MRTIYLLLPILIFFSFLEKYILVSEATITKLSFTLITKLTDQFDWKQLRTLPGFYTLLGEMKARKGGRGMQRGKKKKKRALSSRQCFLLLSYICKTITAVREQDAIFKSCKEDVIFLPDCRLTAGGHVE